MPSRHHVSGVAQALGHMDLELRDSGVAQALGHMDLELRDHALQQLPEVAHMVDDDNAVRKGVRSALQPPIASRLALLRSHRDREEEPTPLTQLAFHPDATSMHLHERLADGEAQP